MKRRIIDIPENVTSYEFYNNILTQINLAIQKNNVEIILDCSKTEKIEPLVIPNLLCLGYKIKESTGEKAEIYVPDTITAGPFKNYLEQIDFLSHNQKCGLYKFTSSPYGGAYGKNIDPICGTLYFDVNTTVDEISYKIKRYVEPFSERYLNRFTKECIQKNAGQSKIYYMNEITEFLREIIINCKQHAKTFSFATLHAKYSTKKIYISVSDIGPGFGGTIYRDHIQSGDEKDAILQGVYKRKNSKVYGLFNVIRRVLEFGGKVRIHSNDTQIIFTPRYLEAFMDGNLEKEFFIKYNIKRQLRFEGVHIELELPLE